MVQEDPELQNLSKDRQQELIDDLKETRVEKKNNARGSNKAAARNVQSTIDKVSEEVSCHYDPLNQRVKWYNSWMHFSSARDLVHGCSERVTASMTSLHKHSSVWAMPLNSSPRYLARTLGNLHGCLSNGRARERKVSI